MGSVIWHVEAFVAVQSRCFQWWHHTEEACPRATLRIGVNVLSLKQKASYKLSTFL